MKKEKIYAKLLAGTLMVGSIVHGSKQDPSMPELGRGNRPIASRTVSKVPRDVSEAALVLADALHREALALEDDALRREKNKLVCQILEQVGISYEEEFLSHFNPERKRFDKKAINEAKMCFVKYFWEKRSYYLCSNVEDNINQHFKQLDHYNFKQLDHYSQLIVAQYLNSTYDIKELTLVCKKNRALLDKFRKNHWPLTKKNKKLFPKIETQVIYTPFDYIKPGMWRYIIAHPVTAKEINDYVKKLKPKPVGMSQKEKPIIFETRIISDANEVDNALAEENKDIEIKKFLITTNYNLDALYRKLKAAGKTIILSLPYVFRTKVTSEMKENCKCLFQENYVIKFADYACWKNYAKIIIWNVAQENCLKIIQFLLDNGIPCKKYAYINKNHILIIKIEKDNECKLDALLKWFNKEGIKELKDKFLNRGVERTGGFPGFQIGNLPFLPVGRFQNLPFPEPDFTMGPDIFREVEVDATNQDDLNCQLKILLKDKNVREIRVPNHLSIPLEYAGCTKIKGVLRGYDNPNADLFLPSKEIALDDVICKNIYSTGGFCFDNEKVFNVENLYICSKVFEESLNEGKNCIVNHAVYVRKNNKNRCPNHLKNVMQFYDTSIVSKINAKLEKFISYVEWFNLEYLSGFVNFENKPDELTDTEWTQVKKLKEKVEEIKIAMRGSILAYLKTMNPAYTLRNVRGDGNCGVYAVLQALHPEQNYLNVQPNDERWNEAQNLRNNVLPVGHPGREMAQNAGDHVRWIEDQDFQHFAQHLRRNILFISEQNQFIEYDRNGNIRTYGSLEEAFEQKAQDAIIIYHNGIDHFQTVIPMPNA